MPSKKTKLEKFREILTDPVHPREEKTCVLIKQDAIKRGLIGEIIKRFENRGLKIVALRMIKADKKTVQKHYPNSREYIINLGNKSLSTYERYNLDPIKELGSRDPFKIGKLVRSWLIDFISSGPLIKMVVEGSHAVDIVRKIVGDTQPAFALPGTIRGDFESESASLANFEKRSIKNLIHASSTKEEATKEIMLWFKPDEVCDYKRVEEAI